MDGVVGAPVRFAGDQCVIVRCKGEHFRLGLHPLKTVRTLDWRGEVRGRRGGSADPLRRGVVEPWSSQQNDALRQSWHACRPRCFSY